MTRPPRVSIADLADGAAGAPLLDGDGTVRDPLLTVDLDGPAGTETIDRAIRQAQSSDRLLVGTTRRAVSHRLVSALDLTVAARPADARPGDARPGDPRKTGGERSGDLRGGGRDVIHATEGHEPLLRLGEAVARNPLAAIALRDVLRTTEGLPVPAALDIESYAYSTLLGGPEFARWLAERGPRPLPPEVPDPVLVRREGERLRITLNRPERRNAYGRALRDALVDALSVALLDDGIATVTLDGAGPAFCSGGDLAEFGTAPDLATAHLVRTRAGAGRLIHRLGSRLEARVHGACVGAGIELAAFAGRVIARPDAVFRLPEVSMGLIPGAGGTVSLPRRIGRWRTLYLGLTGEPLDAETARAWGLVDGIDADAGTDVGTITGRRRP